MGAKADGRRLKDGAKQEKKRGEKESGVANGKAVEGVLAGDQAKAQPAWENPLVPNAVLREMYRKMVEIRMLEEHARRSARGSTAKSEWKSTRDQEACWVSVAQGLESGDLVMDSQPGSRMNYLLGTELVQVLSGIGPVRKVAAQRRAASKEHGKPTTGTSQVLPFVKETEARVFAGLGAALLLKNLKRTDGVVIYLESREVGNGWYRRALTLAATQELAVIFFVFPDSKRGRAKSKARVIDCKMPAMTVEASDAIALYRVVQESVGRFRAGGGPVLIEGVSFPTSANDVAASDPVEQLRRYMLNRRVCTEDWIADTEQSFRKRLAKRG